MRFLIALLTSALLLAGPVQAQMNLLTGAGGKFKVSSAGPMTTPILFMNNSASSPSNANTSSYSAMTGPGNFSTTVDRPPTPIAIPGTFSNLYFSAPSGIGTGTWAATLRKNGADTALTCTISSGTTCTNASTVSVVAGDLMDWKVTSASSPTANTTVQISATFVGTNNNESPIFSGWTSNIANTGAGYLSLTTGNNSTTEVNASSVMPTAGTLDHIYVNLSAAPGAAKLWTFTVWKNGAATSLTCNVSGAAATTCNSPGQGTDTAVSVVAGDLISIEMCPATTSGGVCQATTSPTAAIHGVGLRWQPTTVGESVAFSNIIGNCPSGGNTFMSISGYCSSSATQSITQNVSPVAMHYTKMYIYLSTNVGVGATRVNTLQAGGATASGGAACTISAGAATCSNTGNYSSSAGDLMNIANTFTGSPGTNTYSKASITMTVP